MSLRHKISIAENKHSLVVEIEKYFINPVYISSLPAKCNTNRIFDITNVLTHVRRLHLSIAKICDEGPIDKADKHGPVLLQLRVFVVFLLGMCWSIPYKGSACPLVWLPRCPAIFWGMLGIISFLWCTSVAPTIAECTI